eukprot:Protomagalhaensia_sp_Gyna_25__1762@NODE_1928_length_1411_cov_95_609329_g1587_i0_p1_GENE_NODE_1928_length_1411_cov_95_609329_g1587_i0NODE_1928_length_1411_cov_95_609329_g1587_i0_p1_ORF_typecomplete_len339_score40_40_NODE_1928_length_1411_cov_95_609329_g1587_i01161132
MTYWLGPFSGVNNDLWGSQHHLASSVATARTTLTPDSTRSYPSAATQYPQQQFMLSPPTGHYEWQQQSSSRFAMPRQPPPMIHHQAFCQSHSHHSHRATAHSSTTRGDRLPPSVVTPSAVPPDFAARVPLLTFNPRTTTATPFFRRSARQARPVPRPAALVARPSPRAASLEPPRSRGAPAQHQRAASALLPPAGPKRPRGVPPLPLNKLLLAAPGPVSKPPPIDWQQRSNHPSNGGATGAAAAKSSDWQVCVTKNQGNSNWQHSHQPTISLLANTGYSSQRYMFADVDSARAPTVEAEAGTLSSKRFLVVQKAVQLELPRHRSVSRRSKPQPPHKRD